MHTAQPCAEPCAVHAADLCTEPCAEPSAKYTTNISARLSVENFVRVSSEYSLQRCAEVCDSKCAHGSACQYDYSSMHRLTEDWFNISTPSSTQGDTIFRTLGTSTSGTLHNAEHSAEIQDIINNFTMDTKEGSPDQSQEIIKITTPLSASPPLMRIYCVIGCRATDTSLCWLKILTLFSDYTFSVPGFFTVSTNLESNTRWACVSDT